MPKYALLTFPKAGSQWVRDVLFGPQVLACTPGLFFSHPLGPDVLEVWQSRGDGACGGPFYGVRPHQWAQWARPEDRAVLVIRDPRDVIVSWVFSILYSHSKAMSPTAKRLRAPMEALSMRHRMMVGIETDFSLRIGRLWTGDERDARVMEVRYEGLIADSVPEFASIAAHFGWSVPREILAPVTREFSFEVRSGGRAPGDTDEKSHFRRGIAGDWRNYFDRELGVLLEETNPGGLRALGYETSDDWYEALPSRMESLDGDGSESRPAEGVRAANELDRLRRRLVILESAYAAQRTLLEEVARLEGGAI